MTISNTSSLTNPYQANASTGFGQQMTDFKSLASALQSGDLSSAQDAFTTLQSDLQNAQTNGKTSPLTDPNTPVGKDFQALQTALKSGDLKATQDAFATLKQDVRKTHGGHHHHKKVGNDGGADTSSTSATTDSSVPATEASTQEAGSTLNVTA